MGWYSNSIVRAIHHAQAKAYSAPPKRYYGFGGAHGHAVQRWTSRSRVGVGTPISHGHAYSHGSGVYAHPWRNPSYASHAFKMPHAFTQGQTHAALIAIAAAQRHGASGTVLAALLQAGLNGSNLKAHNFFGDGRNVLDATKDFVALAKHLEGKYAGNASGLAAAVLGGKPQQYAAQSLKAHHLLNGSGPGHHGILTAIQGHKIGHADLKAFLNHGSASISKASMPSGQKAVFAAAGKKYGIPADVLWSIYGVESNYGKNPSTSSAGAQGPMQFIPSTWAAYGRGKSVHDLKASVDAAARYLKAAGGQTNIRKAIFAYNHAGWYVDKVLANRSAWHGGGNGGPIPSTGSYGSAGSVGSSSVPRGSSSAGSSVVSNAMGKAAAGPAPTSLADAKAQILRQYFTGAGSQTSAAPSTDPLKSLAKAGSTTVNIVDLLTQIKGLTSKTPITAPPVLKVKKLKL